MLLDAERRRCARNERARRSRWLWRALTVVVLAGAALIALRTLHGSLARAASDPSKVNPLLSLVRDDADRGPLVGRVEERLRAGSYAYHAVRLEHDGSLQWVVALGKGLPAGTRARVRSFGYREEFRSSRLGRTFSKLAFGIVSRVEAAEDARASNVD